MCSSHIRLPLRITRVQACRSRINTLPFICVPTCEAAWHTHVIMVFLYLATF